MPVPAGVHDPSHLERRLLGVAAALEKALEEVRRAMEELAVEEAADRPTTDDT